MLWWTFVVLKVSWLIRLSLILNNVYIRCESVMSVVNDLFRWLHYSVKIVLSFPIAIDVSLSVMKGLKLSIIGVNCSLSSVMYCSSLYIYILIPTGRRSKPFLWRSSLKLIVISIPLIVDLFEVLNYCTLKSDCDKFQQSLFYYNEE